MSHSDDNPVFSVIIPAYNEEKKYLREAIQSIFEDSFDSFEVIVVDDGSTDNTAAVVKAFPAVKYVYQENQGDAAARNKGVSVSRGGIIAFLDSDDIWLPGRFARSYDYLSNHPDVVYLLGQAIMFLEEGYARPAFIKPEWLEQPVDSAATNVLTARRKCFDLVGPFNPAYRKNSDTEWLLRANEANVKMISLPFPVIKRRIHDENLSHTTIEDFRRVVFQMMRESIQRKNKKQ